MSSAVQRIPIRECVAPCSGHFSPLLRMQWRAAYGYGLKPATTSTHCGLRFTQKGWQSPQCVML